MSDTPDIICGACHYTCKAIEDMNDHMWLEHTLGSEHNATDLEQSPSVASMPSSPDQVDALDEILYGTIGIGYAGKPPHNQNSLKKVVGIQDAKAKLSALLVEARIDELNRKIDLQVEDLGQSFLDGFNYAVDQLEDVKRWRMKELQQGALAHAESLPASGKQADKSVVRELLRLRKLYDRYELEDTADHDGNALATWSGYKAFRNPISDRIEEITGVRSDQEVTEWLSQRLPQTDNQDKPSKNASSEELEKQREATE